MRPSDLLEMRQQGVSSSLRFDLDAAVIDFMEWVSAEMKAQVIGKDESKKPNHKRGESWVDKYESVDEVLTLYAQHSTAAADVTDEPLPDEDQVAQAIADWEAQQPVLD